MSYHPFSQQTIQNWCHSQPSSLLPTGLGVRLEAGAAGTAEAGVILIATELGLQDQRTVGQLRLVDAVLA